MLVLGFANLVADAISMGFGDIVSASSERDVIVEERRVTEWDVMNHRSNEQTELIRYYEALGMDNNDATTVTKTSLNSMFQTYLVFIILPLIHFIRNNQCSFSFIE